MLFHHIPARAGYMSHIRKTVGQIEHALHTGAKVYKAISSLVPDSQAKSAVTKATDDYMALRDRVKRAMN